MPPGTDDFCCAPGSQCPRLERARRRPPRSTDVDLDQTAQTLICPAGSPRRCPGPGRRPGRRRRTTRSARRCTAVSTCVRPSSSWPRTRMTSRPSSRWRATPGSSSPYAAVATAARGTAASTGASSSTCAPSMRWTSTWTRARRGRGRASPPGQYTIAAAEHGLATGFGDTGSVGLGGLTLGGGVGYLSRKHGLTIDNLLAVEIVTADGQLRQIDESPTRICSGQSAAAVATSGWQRASSSDSTRLNRRSAGYSSSPPRRTRSPASSLRPSRRRTSSARSPTS